MIVDDDYMAPRGIGILFALLLVGIAFMLGERDRKEREATAPPVAESPPSPV